MLAFLIRRTLLGCLTLFVVITLIFFLVRLLPGNPFSKERKLPKQIEANMMAKYGLNEPLPWQYLKYMRDLLKGDLRLSFSNKNRTVNEIIGQTLPVSLTLGAIAFILSIGVGVTLGSYAAVKHGSWKDQVSMILAILCVSFPNFLLAPLLILVFALHWTFFPVAGWDSTSHLVLPSLCLALPFIAYVARLTRNSMLDVVNQDYIRTARAKGLSEFKVVFLHALKVGILPVVSFSGPLAANILTGSLIVEQIFNVPGMGQFFINSIFNRDYFMTLGTAIIYSSLLIFFNVLVDVIYTFLDRRIKLS